MTNQTYPPPVSSLAYHPPGTLYGSPNVRLSTSPSPMGPPGPRLHEHSGMRSLIWHRSMDVDYPGSKDQGQTSSRVVQSRRYGGDDGMPDVRDISTRFDYIRKRFPFISFTR